MWKNSEYYITTELTYSVPYNITLRDSNAVTFEKVYKKTLQCFPTLGEKKKTNKKSGGGKHNALNMIIHGF